MYYAYFATNASAAPEARGREFFGNSLTIFTTDNAPDREGGTMLIREAINAVRRLHIDDTTREKVVSYTLKWLLKLS